MLRNVWTVCRQLTEILLGKQSKTIQNKTQLTKKNTKKNKRNKKEYENCTYVEKGGEHAAENRKKRTYAFNRCRQMARIFVVALRRRRRRRRHCCVLLSLCFRCFGFAWLAHDSDSLLATHNTHARTHTHTDTRQRTTSVCCAWRVHDLKKRRLKRRGLRNRQRERNREHNKWREMIEFPIVTLFTLSNTCKKCSILLR